MADKISDRIDRMRPCVKAAFEKGAQNKSHLTKMTHAIIFELKRLGIEKAEIKRALLEWNQKNFQILTEGDARRRLCDYADWLFSQKDCKLGCKALGDYCIYPNSFCWFRPQIEEGEAALPFSLSDAMDFLEKEYQPHGYLMGLLLKSLSKIQVEKNAKSIIYVGVRTIQARLLEEDHHDIDLMGIVRALNKLEEAGFIRITHGQSGTFGMRPANGYSFQPWAPP
jgi:DNA-binding transcriptional regulator YhcF (GntR family)